MTCKLTKLVPFSPEILMIVKKKSSYDTIIPENQAGAASKYHMYDP